MIKKALKTEFNYIVRRPRKFLGEDWSKVYVILTFCRIIYTLRTNKIKSKKAAALLSHPTHGVNESSLDEIISFGGYISTVEFGGRGVHSPVPEFKRRGPS